MTDPRLRIDPGLGDAAELVANIVIDAIEWLDADASLAVQLAGPHDLSRPKWVRR